MSGIQFGICHVYWLFAFQLFDPQLFKFLQNLQLKVLSVDYALASFVTYGDIR